MVLHKDLVKCNDMKKIVSPKAKANLSSNMMFLKNFMLVISFQWFEWNTFEVDLKNKIETKWNISF